MNKNNQSRLHNRTKRIFFLYRNYLLKNILNDSLESIEDEWYEFSIDQKNFIKKILKHIDQLEIEIFKHIPEDWSWKRFGNMEKAIILNAASELLLGENKKSIVINDSIEIAKKYCGQKSQPLINAIIDKIVIPIIEKETLK